MRALVVLAALVAALAVPATAAAGGWATVGFQPLPDGMAAGAAWKPRILVKQHGITPLAGLEPVVVIEEAGTGATQRFAARETSEAGVYEADVVFPNEGDWRVTVHSGFGDSFVTYGPTSIGPAGGGSQPLPFVVLALVLVGGLAVLGARRWRSLSPANS